eukprot:13401842-Heterocapsa_arctica.AAC.1
MSLALFAVSRVGGSCRRSPTVCRRTGGPAASLERRDGRAPGWKALDAMTEWKRRGLGGLNGPRGVRNGGVPLQESRCVEAPGEVGVRRGLVEYIGSY